MRRSRGFSTRAWTWLTVACLGMIAVGCSSTIRSIPSGFLGDYSDFRPDESRSGALVFENTALDMAEYDRVLIDPVLFHYHAYATSYAIEPYELTMMADYFYNAILDAVDGVYTVTDEPGPRTLRLSAAITGIKPANPTRNVISEVVGQAVGLAALPSIVPLKIPLEISEAAMEAELTDSVTGERLAAIVDSRKPRNVPLLSTFDLSRYTRTGYSRNAGLADDGNSQGSDRGRGRGRVRAFPCRRHRRKRRGD